MENFSYTLNHVVVRDMAPPKFLVILKVMHPPNVENYYIPGEQCIAICQVDNFKGSIGLSEIRCDLIKVITLTSFMGVENVFESAINTMIFPGIAAFNMYVG